MGIPFFFLNLQATRMQNDSPQCGGTRYPRFSHVFYSCWTVVEQIGFWFKELVIYYRSDS